jgi:predicted phage-related endonuclease
MMFPESKTQVVRFDEQLYEHINGLVEQRTGGLEVINSAKKEVEGIEAQLKQFLGEAELGETDRYRISWKTQNRKEYVVQANSFRVFRCIDKNKTEG